MQVEADVVVIIKRIPKEETWELRHRVLWPDKDLSFVQMREDDNGLHFGLYEGQELVSVLSLFVNGHDAQFRKFATLPGEQGKGYGSLLLHHVLLEAASLGATRIWCNARATKAGYYERFGLQKTTKEPFEKNGLLYFVMEIQLI
ncbi:GNAT family N-acetyltransferase [Brevibacillus choshinensis]|uniref:GNAT family N-acetyltransferase n=1 Tax=Brevibacillus choshinensis TaxID=54911 RepID=UPI002E1BB04B|nr:GNAT family N-acetyltransferase [Brevibacillus choshinensis]MED4784348.1 GNAT family N-acetyltransferase [Brevibacillus choshinensis]